MSLKDGCGIRVLRIYAIAPFVHNILTSKKLTTLFFWSTNTGARANELPSGESAKIPGELKTHLTS